MDGENNAPMKLSLQDVKDLYHRALHPTQPPTHTWDTLPERDKTDVIAIVSNDAKFTNYTTSLNVDLLPGRLIDFSQDEDLINTLNKLIPYMECDLRSTFRYPGHIVRVGSCRDESRVGRVNEMDTLYVIDRDFASELRQNEKGYAISMEGKPIAALNLIGEFAEAVEISAHKWRGINTESDLQHGGFAAPQFTGVRYNGPAVTLLFTYESKKQSRVIKDISLDMTLAFVLPPEDSLRKHISEQLSTVQKVHTGKVISKEGVHFVPNVVNGRWMVTTAQLEADLFQSLPNKSVVKQAFRFVKIISHDINKYNTQDERLTVPEVMPISTMLEKYKLSSQSYSTDVCSNFTKCMRYAHSFLSPREAVEHNESAKEDVSINTAALKHVLLSEALKTPEYFNDTSRFDDDVYALVMKAFEIFLQQNSTVPHSLIEDVGINMFSFSKPSLLSKLCPLLEAVLRRKCYQMLRKIQLKKITSTGELHLDPSTNVVTSLNRYLVPFANINAGCAAEYFYEVSLDPSVSPKRCPFISHIKILVNALQNTCGGKVAATTCDREVDENNLSHWRQHVKGCLPSSITFEDSSDLVEFRIQGITLLQSLRIKPTGMVDYSCSEISDHEECAIHFLLNDDGCVEKVQLTRSKHTDSNASYFQTAHPERTEEFPLPPISMHDANPSNGKDVGSTGVISTEVHSRSSYSFKSKPDLGLSSNTFDSTELPLDKLRIFSQKRPANFTPPIEVTRCDTTIAKVVSEIGQFSQNDAFAILSGNILTCFTNNTLYDQRASVGSYSVSTIDATMESSCVTPELMAAERTKLADLIHVDSQPNIFVHSIYTTHAQECQNTHKKERTYAVARVLMKRLNQHIELDDSEDICVYPITHFVGENNTEKPEIKRTSLQLTKLKQGLGRLLLLGKSSFKDIINNEISIYLTGEQIETVQGIETCKFCVIEGPPGCGKTLLEQHLCEKLGKANSAILCPCLGVRNTINHQGKADAFSVPAENQIVRFLSTRVKDRKYLIIDDAQHINWKKDTWRAVFSMIDSSNKHLYLFMDSTYQVYKGEQSMRIVKKIVAEYNGYAPFPMKKIYRNSKVIFEYMRNTSSCIESDNAFECRNPMEGDDAKLTNVPFLMDTSAKNGLVGFVKAQMKPSNSKYEFKDVAVLFEDAHRAINPIVMRNIFERHLPESHPQTSEKVPAAGIIIDSVDNFLGLEARFVIVVLGEASDLTNSRYKMTIASRAVERIEFVRELFDKEHLEQLHFEHAAVEAWSDETDETGITLDEDDHALLYACKAGDLRQAEEALDGEEFKPGGESVDLRSKRWRVTPLMVAAFWGHTKLVQMLVERGSNLQAGDIVGRTASHWARIGGHHITTDYLDTALNKPGQSGGSHNIDTRDWKPAEYIERVRQTPGVMSDVSETIKYAAFVAEPLGYKSVYSVPGIGPIYGERLESAGYTTAGQLVGQYMVCGSDAAFKTWLMVHIAGPNPHPAANVIVVACREWTNHHK